MTDPFDTATYYDCDDDEEALAHESPEEAIVYCFEAYADPDAPLRRAIIGDMCPLTVAAFQRVAVDWGPIARAAAVAAIDEWLEEYGGPDGYDDISDETRADLARAFCATLARVLRDATPWRCELVATREYSAAEVEEILREACPEWFEGKEGHETARQGDGWRAT